MSDLEVERVEGSTLKESEMQFRATSMLSASSGERVPSLVEEERKSQMARARRCLVVRAACFAGG
jgi:hypothetical protein